MRCLAIDDEPIALSILRAHAQKVPFLQFQEGFVSATEALAYLQQHPTDLVFLDINMPDISGIEVAKLIGQQASIIFTTGATTTPRASKTEVPRNTILLFSLVHEVVIYFHGGGHQQKHQQVFVEIMH